MFSIDPLAAEMAAKPAKMKSGAGVGTWELPDPTPEELQGRFAAKIYFDAEHQQKFPIGAQGAAAI